MQPIKTVTLRVVERHKNSRRIHVVYEGCITTPVNSFIEAMDQVESDKEDGIVEKNATIEVKG